MPTDENEKYKWFVLAILTTTYMFNYVDRQVMIILQEDIKAELLLSDTQLGILTGIGFAILYTTMGIPIAKFADKSNRKNIIALSVGFWSFMTILSGRAQNFYQLLLTRIGVSLGEAGGTPPAHSIISDYFPPKKRATALAIYSMGIYIGVLFGFVIAGLIAKNYGWRVAFYALGLPGLLFSVFLYFTLKEPVKGRMDEGSEAIKDPTFKEVVQTLFSNKSFIYTGLGVGFSTFFLYGLSNFAPSFLQRVHQLDLLTVSIALGLSSGIGGVIGVYMGGRIADAKGATNKRWYLYVPLLSVVLSIIPAILFLYSDNPMIAMAMVFPHTMITAAFNGPVYAVGHSLVNAKMRAFSSAVLLLFLNGIGLAFGPLFVGMLSDYLLPQYGDLSLRYALTFAMFSLVLASLFFWLASRHYEQDLANRAKAS